MGFTGNECYSQVQAPTKANARSLENGLDSLTDECSIFNLERTGCTESMALPSFKQHYEFFIKELFICMVEYDTAMHIRQAQLFRFLQQCSSFLSLTKLQSILIVGDHNKRKDREGKQKGKVCCVFDVWQVIHKVLADRHSAFTASPTQTGSNQHCLESGKPLVLWPILCGHEIRKRNGHCNLQ